MSDNAVPNDVNEVPEFDEELESLLIQVLEEAQRRMLEGEELSPFTSVVVKDKLFQETHQGAIEECFASARDTVRNTAGGRIYAFCYDGYIETDEGEKDIVIAEGGVVGESQAYAVGVLYEIDSEGFASNFSEEVVYIAETANFWADMQVEDATDTKGEDEDKNASEEESTEE